MSCMSRGWSGIVCQESTGKDVSRERRSPSGKEDEKVDGNVTKDALRSLYAYYFHQGKEAGCDPE